MADTKISALTELTVNPTGDDEFVLVDKSDTSMAASGTDKRIKAANLVAPLFAGWRPTGAKIETFPRDVGTSVTGTAPASGTLQLTALAEPLRAGVTYTSITFVNLSTALSLGTSPHFWFTLIKASDRTALRSTADDTAASWGTNAAKTVNLSSTYTPTVDTEAYVGMMISMTGGTMPIPARATVDAILTSLAPIMCGTSNTGATTPPSDGTTMTALTATARAFYAYVS